MEIKYYGDKITHHIAKTPEGFLICQDVPISRTGYQTYLSSEMFDDPVNKHRAIPVYRPASEVFDIKSLASFEGKPVTNEHPEEDVRPENYSKYACGHVQNVHVGVGRDANKVLADLYITDPHLIYLIQHGKREISCGYYAEERRDADGRICQTRIRGNHVAVVKNGRAGRNVCIRDKKPFLLESNMKRKKLGAYSNLFGKRDRSFWDELDDEILADDELSDDEFGDDDLSDCGDSDFGDECDSDFGDECDDDLSDDDFGDDDLSDDDFGDDDLSDDDFGDDDLSDDEFGDDDLSDDDFGDDELSDDDFGDDEFGDDDLSDDDFGDDEFSDADYLADDEFGDDEFGDDELSDDDEVEENVEVDDPNGESASIKEVIADSRRALIEVKKMLRDAKRMMYGTKSKKNKKKDAVILSDDDLSYDELSDDDLITSDDDLSDADYLADDEFGDDEFGDDELSDDEIGDDEFGDDEISDEEVSDDDVSDEEEECPVCGAEAIDPDKEKALREITEASRGISDPNERKQLQDAIYKALCKKSQMPGLMKLTKKNKKNRMDSVPCGKVSLSQQQSIYDSFNPHKKTSF